jgi:hypothetical protein
MTGTWIRCDKYLTLRRGDFYVLCDSLCVMIVIVYVTCLFTAMTCKTTENGNKESVW